MALIFLGSTVCPLCDKILNEGEEIYGLPPSPFKDHPLYKYFDCGFHTQCFENWDKKDEALALIVKQKEDFKNSDEYKEIVAKYGKPKNNWL